MEEELKQHLPEVDIALIPSGGGVFEVSFNKKLIFSKKSLNRFPEKNEIVTIISKIN